MKQSKFLSLGWRDFLRGLIVAILTPILVLIQQYLDSGNLVFNYKILLISGIAGGLSYLIKNVFTKPDNQIKAFAAEDDGPGGSNPPPGKDDK